MEELLNPDLEELPSKEDYESEESIVVGPADVDKQLGVVSYYHRKLDEIEQIKQRRIHQIEHWAEKRKGSVQNRIDWHVQGLQHFLSLSKQKSLSLPNGKIYKRKRQPKFIFPEDRSDEYKVFCANNSEGNFTKKSIKIDKVEIRKAFFNDGVIPDGIEVELDQEEKFHYNLKGEDTDVEE